jgi:hypothetical protein
MTTPLAPSPAVYPQVPLTARQRACLERIARRQTSSQRLGRRAKILLALETGAHQCQVRRQLPLNRGTVQTWRQRGLALASKLEQMEVDGGSDKALPALIRAALTAHPRAGTPATWTAAQMIHIVAVACEDPADAGRPISHGPPREVAAEGRKRGSVEPMSTRRVGRFVKSGRFTAASGGILAQRQAGCPGGVCGRGGSGVCSVPARASRRPARGAYHQDR